ncbi:uncharacterized protein LOC128736626 [Sabethes cyaneus]|uniref:uncharacterized protein LOC128736626 n=1 Tax=Sabethes cyaneus TaxID=53552 RepID=UPI00237D7F14|nr:uncharacterized protein LOC128736626 [Sabethes cyaneus]
MEVLLNRRNIAFARLKRQYAGAKQLCEQNPPVFQVHDRLQKLAELEETFEKTQAEIEELSSPDDLPSTLNMRSDFETVFYATKSQYMAMLKDEHHESASNETIADPSSDIKEAVRVLLETQRVLLTRQTAASTSVEELAVQFRGKSLEPIDTQLPSFNLPIFYGDRKQWSSFKDLFTSSVDRKNLTGALKLQLLVSHLGGEAKGLVSSYAITDVNYKEVWDTLVEHYDKPKFAVSALVQEFCDQPVLKVPNLTNLRKLVSTSDEVIRQLKALGEQYESRDPWLIHLILRKLDDGLRSQWAQHIVDMDSPTFSDMLKFLKRKCDTFETCAAFGGKSFDQTKHDTKEERKYPPVKKEVKCFGAIQKLQCPVCGEKHTIYQCTEFKEASVEERRNLAQQSKLCFNCLRSKHYAKVCLSKSVCRVPECKQRHHTLLCHLESLNEVNSKTAAKGSEKQPVLVNNDENDSSAVSCSANIKTSFATSVFGTLPTAVVRIKGKNEVFHEIRAMIDCGSQATLITESCVTQLGLKRQNAKIVITGVTNSASETTRGAVNLEIASRFDYNPIISTRAYVLSKLTRNLPQQKINTGNLKCLESLQLADPEFDKPSKIDLILGVDVFLSILGDGKVNDNLEIPIAMNSAFGWIVAGQVGCASTLTCRAAIICLHTEVDIDRTLRQFWEIEEILKPKPLTVDEEKAIESFRATHKRDTDGRFTVSLPFDQSKPPLGESLTAATQRLKAMERKFKADSTFKVQYFEFLAEYLNLGHMELIPAEEVSIAQEKRFYLPHHAVLKASSTTTKLRVVFDGSCKTSTGISLNDRLLVGPNLNEDLFTVLTRFRTYAVAFTADAEKMYRQGTRRENPTSDEHDGRNKRSSGVSKQSMCLFRNTEGTPSAPELKDD